MKHHHRMVALFLLAGLLLASLPVLYAMHQARRQAVAEKYQELDRVALGLDRRVRNAMETLSAMHHELSTSGVAPCSNAGIGRLQHIAARTQITIAALYVQDGRVLCSSSDPLLRQLLLGEPTPGLPGDTRVYSQVRLPGMRNVQYSVIERGGHALLIYPDGMISPFARPDLSLGLFNPHTGTYSARSGVLRDGWTMPATVVTTGPDHFLDTGAGYLVARHVTQPSTTGVIVATPISSIDLRMAQFGRWFIPAGIAVGLSVMAMALLFIRRQFSVRVQLLRALHKEQFYLLYQPVLDLRDGRCIGAEALLRWRYDDGTVQLPDRFIPIAEDVGLVSALTGRVLKLVERDLTHFLRRLPDFRIALNVAASDLQSNATPSLLAAMQQSIGTGCGQFVVEATERELLEETSTLSVVEAIRTLGIKIAIDDFGTGYSSLAYLTTYPFDILKIDKSFTATACTQAVTSQVAEHILDLARTLGMQPLVEGIETQQQADFFRSRGVVYGQGYLLGRPMPAEELFAFVAAHSRPGRLQAPLEALGR